MHTDKLLFRKETLAPLAGLALATTVSIAFVVVRVINTGNIHYSFLIWNLFLAWLPLMFALLAREQHQHIPVGGRLTWRFLSLSAAWVLFFPNAPYICTDIVHLTHRFFGPFWVDLAMFLSCAFTGLVLGCVSLYFMHSIVIQKYGHRIGWLFVVVMSGLASLGIYLGRFLRFNSWDVIAQPGKLYSGLSAVATGQGHPHQFAFLVLFASFFFIAYVVLYGLTHLPKVLVLPAADPKPTTNVTAPACA